VKQKKANFFAFRLTDRPELCEGQQENRMMVFRTGIIFCLLFLTGITYSCKPAAEDSVNPAAKGSSVTKPSTDFKVATYNINWGNPDLSKTADLIRDMDADLVALQETNRVSEKFLVERLGSLYPHTSFHKGNMHGADGFAFLSKQPLSNVTFLEPEHGLFGTLICEVTLAGCNVRIISLHLEPILPPRDSTARDIFKLSMKGEEVRKKQYSSIQKYLTDDLPTIVLGDFNSMSSQSVPTLLKEAGFVDSYAAVTKDPDKSFTWQWNYRDMNLQFRIDFIFHPKDLRTVKSDVLNEVAVSDHFPVVSVLEWIEGKK
jgi:endonuclease/exonuclease/phosphatase family metal-dependent hydrolase